MSFTSFESIFLSILQRLKKYEIQKILFRPSVKQQVLLKKKGINYFFPYQRKKYCKREKTLTS